MRSGWVKQGLLLMSCAALTACSAGDAAGNLVGGSVGGRWGEAARAAVGGSLDSWQQQNTKFSPEQEYFLGRAVAAEAVAKYGLDQDETRQQYVREIGASIVRLSSRLKDTYGGYHFAVLDSDEQNGLSGPGGYVFITRGALLRCNDEDEVAAILCHELGHVSLMHGERIIRAGRSWQAGAQVIGRIVGAAADADNGALSGSITKMLGDVSGELVRTLTETGYGREFELEADREGTFLLYDVGYDAASIRDYLQAAPGRPQGTWASHPPAAMRIAALEDVAQRYGGDFDGGAGRAARAARYQRTLGAGGATAAMPAMPMSPPGGSASVSDPVLGEVVETRVIHTPADPLLPPGAPHGLPPVPGGGAAR